MNNAFAAGQQYTRGTDFDFVDFVIFIVVLLAIVSVWAFRKKRSFYSNLKSLFISPRYVPEIQLQFFESSSGHTRYGQRNYSPFYQKTTRCIYCDINTKSAQPQFRRNKH